MIKINNKIFKKMLVSGANNVYNHYPEVDKLNVFPVPDGDTGTNMYLTIANAVKAIEEEENDSITELSNAFSRGLIWGARGNSGVIFSQIFRGFSKKINKKNIIGDDLLDAWKEATNMGYKAVMEPVEGTILTVVREATEKTIEQTKDKNDCRKIMNSFLENARQSLHNTPNLLPVLKEVGVVDSGGAGFVYFIEGMVQVLNNGRKIEKKTNISSNVGNNINLKLDEENFGYCTEVITLLEKEKEKDIDINKVQTILKDQGCKSIVAVQDAGILKVHVHSLIPGQILNYLQQFGEFSKIKVENMDEQAKKHVIETKKERKLENDYAIIAVVSGEGVYNYYHDTLKINYLIDGGPTMNPSTDDFIKAINQVDAKVVYILPNNSNAILAAEQAAKIEKDQGKSDVWVIPTISIAQGMVGVINFDAEKSAKKNYSAMNSAIKKSVSIQIAKATKTTTINGIDIKQNEYMGIIEKKIYNHGFEFLELIKQLFKKTISKSSEIITIFRGKDATKTDVDALSKYIDEELDIEIEIVDGHQPVYPFILVIE